MKALIGQVKDVVAHIYSNNSSYQKRAIATYYANNALYSDPILSLLGRNAVQRIIQLYFSTFSLDTRSEISQISYSNAPVSFHGRLVNGVIVVVDHSVKISQLTTIGRILSLFQLLPPVTLMSQDGLRCITKLVHVPSELDEDDVSGIIVSHEDIYGLNGLGFSQVFNPILLFVMFFNLIISLSLWAFGLVKKVTGFKFHEPSSSQLTSGNEDDKVIVKRLFGMILSGILASVYQNKESQLNGHVETSKTQ